MMCNVDAVVVVSLSLRLPILISASNIKASGLGGDYGNWKQSRAQVKGDANGFPNQVICMRKRDKTLSALTQIHSASDFSGVALFSLCTKATTEVAWKLFYLRNHKVTRGWEGKSEREKFRIVKFENDSTSSLVLNWKEDKSCFTKGERGSRGEGLEWELKKNKKFSEKFEIKSVIRRHATLMMCLLMCAFDFYDWSVSLTGSRENVFDGSW